MNFWDKAITWLPCEWACLDWRQGWRNYWPWLRVLLDTACRCCVAACAFQARSTVLQTTKINPLCFSESPVFAHRLVGVHVGRCLRRRRLPARHNVVVVDVGHVEGRLRVGWILAGDHFTHRLDEPAAGRVGFLRLGGVWRRRHRRLAQELHRLAPQLVHQGREQRSARSTLKFSKIRLNVKKWDTDKNRKLKKQNFLDYFLGVFVN